MLLLRFASVPRILLFVLICSACHSSQPGTSTPAAPTAGIDLTGMDKSVAPGNDFNAYANGAWVKATEIPADKSSWGPGNILADETRKRTVDLIQQSANSSDKTNPDVRKIADFYSAFMDEATVESKGISPLK